MPLKTTWRCDQAANSRTCLRTPDWGSTQRPVRAAYREQALVSRLHSLLESPHHRFEVIDDEKLSCAVLHIETEPGPETTGEEIAIGHLCTHVSDSSKVGGPWLPLGHSVNTIWLEEQSMTCQIEAPTYGTTALRPIGALLPLDLFGRE